ncbi:MAG: glycosyltransferase family 4 protein [Candidatus Syntropharchaeia archaeon]
MKILMLSWEYPPYKVGGIAEHVYELSRVLSKRGDEVHVVTLGYPPFDEREGVLLYRIPIDPSKPEFIARMNEEMEKIGSYIIESVDIDIVHAHDWMVAGAAIKLASKYGKPLVSTMHSTEFGRSQGIKEEYQARIHEVEKGLVKSSDLVIVCSESMKKEVQDLFDVENISVIPNGVDISKFDFSVNKKAVKERFCGSDGKMILFVGRLVYQKGVNVLIGAMPEVLSKKEKVMLLIVGEGPMRKQLEKDAAYLGIPDSVVFTGYLNDRDVRSLLKSADVTVVPSLYEPFGIVALEAMAAKTPVIVSNVGGLAEVVGEGEGIRVPPDSSERLACAILKILSDKEEDKRRREEMVERAFKKVLSLNWKAISESIIDAYRKILVHRALEKEKYDFRVKIDENSNIWRYS